MTLYFNVIIMFTHEFKFSNVLELVNMSEACLLTAYIVIQNINTILYIIVYKNNYSI